MNEIASVDGISLAMTLLNSSAEILESSGIVRPRWTAEQLLSHRLGCRPVELYLEPPSVTSEQAVRFKADVAARAHGMPLQYLMGSAGFYGREFLVGPGLFIPRPETEVLIDVALGLLRDTAALLRQAQGERKIVVDVGTGSGAIAVTLALELPGIQVQAIDKSPTALSFARRNADRHGCLISFIQGDLLEPLAPNSADLIVANLPYLNPAQAPTWPRELHWEPWLALDGGLDGLSLIQKLMTQAASVLKQDGKLLLEIGAGQSRQIQPDADASRFRVDQVVSDLAGLERVMVLWKN